MDRAEYMRHRTASPLKEYIKHIGKVLGQRGHRAWFIRPQTHGQRTWGLCGHNKI